MTHMFMYYTYNKDIVDTKINVMTIDVKLM